MRTSTKCEYCGATVRWLMGYGRRLPLDPEPVDVGGSHVVIDYRALPISPELLDRTKASALARFTSHFDTCPVLTAKPERRRREAIEMMIRRETGSGP